MINLLLKDHVSGLKRSVVWILWHQNKFWKRHFGQKWVWSADELWLKVGIPPARSTCVHVTYLLKWTKEIILDLVGKLKNFSVVFFAIPKSLSKGRWSCAFKCLSLSSLSSPVINVQFWTLMRFSCLTAYIWKLAPREQELCFRFWSKAGNDQKCLSRTEVGFLLTWFYCIDETHAFGFGQFFT